MNINLSARKPTMLAALLALAIIPFALAQSGQDKPDTSITVPKLPINVINPRPNPDPSPGASVSQIIGVDSQVTILYHRPAVKGRKIWTGDSLEKNSVVPHNDNPGPWRAGANEATVISFPDDVKINGQPLAAGNYSFWIIPTGGDWTLIFNKSAKEWGESYDKAADALRVTAKPEDGPNQEWLAYGFDDLAPNSCMAWMKWGTKKVGFKIELAKPAPVPTPAAAGARRGGAAGAARRGN